MTPVISNESELYVAPGGPIDRLTHRIAIARYRRQSAPRRIISLLLITWVPMCVLALLQGDALGATPRESFLLDFPTYVRFFVAVPIMVIAEGHIGPRLTQAGLQFVRDGLVRQEDYPAFEQAITRLARRRGSVSATLVLIALAVFAACVITFESASGVGMVSLHSLTLPEGHAFRYNLAALWSLIVALPVFQFLWYRWLWRILFWTLFLRDVARLNLRLVPTHADGAGGLGFLARAHNAFGMLAFVVGSALSAEAAFRFVYEGTHIDVFKVPVLIVLVLVLVLFLGPMLVFTPVMARTRRAALRSYGSLVVRYNRAFQDKWLESPSPQGEQLLGSSDIQSLADLSNSFRLVSDMKLIPFGRSAVIQLAVATLLPGLPLVLLAVPISDIFAALAKVVL